MNADAAALTLGEDVKRVRLARGLTQKHLGVGAGYSEGYVSKVEAGVVIPSQKFVAGCDKVFGTGDLFTRQLRRLVDGEHPSWFAPYIDAEREASAIHDYSIAFLLGLLQTPEYARVVLERGPVPLSREELEAQVTSRVRRREILEVDSPPRVWVILHEACLRAQVGSSRLMADQLDHIAGLLKAHPNLTVQVLPYEAAGGATNTPFTILEIPEASPVVYVEGPQGGRPYDTRDVLTNARSHIDHLRACALSAHDSAEYLGTVRDEHARRAMDQVQPQRRNRGAMRRVGPGARVRRQRPGAGQ